MKTQPRASDESKYGEENICIGRTGAQGSLEEPPALLQRLPEVKGQEVLSLPDVWDPQSSDGLLSALCRSLQEEQQLTFQTPFLH